MRLAWIQRMHRQRRCVGAWRWNDTRCARGAWTCARGGDVRVVLPRPTPPSSRTASLCAMTTSPSRSNLRSATPLDSATCAFLAGRAGAAAAAADGNASAALRLEVTLPPPEDAIEPDRLRSGYRGSAARPRMHRKCGAARWVVARRARTCTRMQGYAWSSAHARAGGKQAGVRSHSRKQSIND